MADKLSAVSIDKAAVESTMDSVMVAEPVNATLMNITQPLEIKPSVSLAWVAGPAVGGCVLLALVGYWVGKRRSAQAVQGIPKDMKQARTSNEARDGSTPREAWANAPTRTHAALD
jgi:hypothetical protein